MIRKILYTACFAFFLLFTSCEDFLDEQKEATYTDANYYNDEQTAREVVTACYDIFHSSWPINFWEVHHVLGDIRSDDTEEGGDPAGEVSPQRSDIGRFNITPNNIYVSYIWEFYFAGIWRANVAIEKITQIPESKFTSPQIKARLIAEAKFLRAYHFSFLVKNWGGVPLVDHTLSPEEYTMARASKEDIFNLIKKDLREAIEDLPLKDGTDPGRAKKGTAIYLLTNVLVYQAGTDPNHPNWQEAFDLSNSLIRGDYSGEYQLLPNYKDIWMQGNDFNQETIFEVVHAGTGSESNSYFTYTYPRFVTLEDTTRAGIWGWGLNCPTQNLVDEFETNADWGQTEQWEDPRLQLSIWREGDIVPLGTNDDDNLNDSLPVWLQDTPTGYYMKKIWLNSEPAGFEVEMNAKIFRYSDLILFNAEAAYYTGRENIARESLNMVRARARQGNPDVLPDVTAGGQELLEAIWHERRVELCGEGIRFFDLQRQGKIGETLTAIDENFTINKHELLPIPQTEIDLNPNLKQNQNY